jgi:hypothetical protein
MKNLEQRLAENMIRFGAKNLSWIDEFILSEQNGIDIGSKSGTAFVGKKSASDTAPDREFDEKNYDIPYGNYTGEQWVSMLATNKQIYGFDIVNQVKLMESLMDPGSLQNWKQLKTDPKNVKYGVAAIAYFEKTQPKMKWTNVFVGSEEFITKMKTEGGSMDWQKDISFPLAFPSNPNRQYFDDNTAIIRDEFKSEVDFFIQSIQRAAADAKITDPEFYLLKLSVTTSSSRFRNTGVAADKTWLQLSQERANAASAYVVERMKAAGIFVGKSPNGKYETQYIINPKGSHGDGTTGPNPPAPTPFNTDGRQTWSCADTNQQICTIKNRNDFGTPKPDKSAYDEFKYVIVTVDLVMKNKLVPSTAGEAQQPDASQEIKSNLYTIEFYRKQKGIKIPYWYPTIDVNFKKLNLDNKWNQFVNKVTPGAVAPQRSIDCFFKD